MEWTQSRNMVGVIYVFFETQMAPDIATDQRALKNGRYKFATGIDQHTGTGIGSIIFGIESEIILSRQFGELFRSTRIIRLTRFL